MIRKLLIAPWFGPLPPWYPLWHRNITELQRAGYEVWVDLDRHGFNDRVRDTLGIQNAIRDDGRKVCDFRCAFGVIYAHLLADYPWWGHTDLDMVYGRVERYVTDDFLADIDVFSNHPTYVSGPFSLYRNIPEVNETFMLVEDWRGYLTNPETTGWVETVFSDAIEDHLTWRYENFQTQDLNSFASLHWEGDMLMEGRNEVAMAHFRRTKEYPAGCIR